MSSFIHSCLLFPQGRLGFELHMEKSQALRYKSETFWTDQADTFMGMEGTRHTWKAFFFKKVSSCHFQSSQDLYYCSKYENFICVFWENSAMHCGFWPCHREQGKIYWVGAQLCPILLRPHRIVACQALLSMRISRQEYWSGLPLPTPEDLPKPGMELPSLAFPALQADSLPLSYLGSPILNEASLIQKETCPLTTLLWPTQKPFIWSFF